MTERKFYKHTITVEVLSEDPNLDNYDLHYILNQMDEGDYVGVTHTDEPQTLNGLEVVDELEMMGSEPGFFGLDESGEDDE